MRKNPFTRSSVPPATHSHTRKRNPLSFLWTFLKGIIFALGLTVLLSLILLSFTVSAFLKDTPGYTVPKKGVLYLEFKDALYETPPIPSLTNPFGDNAPTVRQMVVAIDRAAGDPRINGIMARMYDGAFDMAQVQEIRAAIKRFRASGKFTKIYAESYGGSGGGLGRFYLASAFQERWMQPMGVVGITGVRAEVPFIKPLLDTIGISPQFIQKKDYKTAYESAMREEISPENKEMLTDLVNNIQGVLTTDISADMGIDKRIFQSLVDYGLFTADEALAAELITHSGYVDQMIETIYEATGTTGLEPADVFVPVPLYTVKKDPKTPNTALVFVQGAIMSGDGNDVPKGGVASADIIAPAIIEASKNKAIKTIIVRVDSPGGSPAASETILRAIRIAKSNGKKVIVSMGSTAASGGYWVSAYADRIFALPTTLTGSIGVLGGKITLGDMWDKIGVNWNTDVQWGKNAGIWSMNTEFTDTERVRIDGMLTHVYDNFIARVAEGRGLDIDQVDAIAQGRVWTGLQAVQNGLVDDLGGMQDVLNYTANDMGFASAQDLHIAIYPKPLSFAEQILQTLSESGMIMSGLKMQSIIGERLRPIVDEVSVFTQPDFYTYSNVRVE